MSAVLVTGAAGYIGSHAVVELLERGHEVVGLDNFSNSDPSVVDRIADVARPIRCHRADLRDRDALRRVFAAEPVDAVLHFAGLKAVGESVADPMRYYEHNVVGSANLIAEMCAAGVATMVFSSSCTVYGEPEQVPVDESHPLQPVSPYGRTKLIVEGMLRDLCAADERWSVSLLRYFNPIGAHPSGLLGEQPLGEPNNLMPHVMRAALGITPHVRVFGGDYPTPDGTCVRDYIHVVDVAAAHVAALDHLAAGPGVDVFNLGTGRGVSVLELLDATSRAVGHEIPRRIVQRRPGDVVSLHADAGEAERVLGWKARRTVDDMCRDHWEFARRWERPDPVQAAAAGSRA